MEKSNDCYFYYYSNCNKGEKCLFRHEPLALGTEEMCEQWEYGRCIKPNCERRHMVINVKRTETLCYWESQPSGCQKPHCVFKHLNKKSPPSDVPNTDNRESKSENVPSPKVNPVLINFSETDTEESPQKPVRSQPIITVSKSGSAKKISLSSAARPPSSNADHQVKTKSVREIRREKILRAKIEHEKKLLALKMSENREHRDGEGSEVKFTRTVNTSPMDHELPGKLEKEEQKNRSQGNGNEHVNKAMTDISALPIKSFDEIMAEKRKRKRLQNSTNSQSEESIGGPTTKTSRLVDSKPTAAKKISHSVAEKTSHPVDPNGHEKNKYKRTAVVIPPRKMKIRSSNKTQKPLDTNCKYSASGVSNKDRAINPLPKASSKLETAELKMSNLEKITPMTNDNFNTAMQGTDDIDNMLSEDSGGGSSADELLDDDKLLDEMEELLA